MKKYSIALLFFVGFIACNKVTLKPPDDFNVTANNTTIKVFDTVLFHFDGNPDIISFYSGEPNHQYHLKDSTLLTPDSVVLSFATVTTVPNSKTQTTDKNMVAVLVSTNFSGILDSSNVSAATWTSISDSATFAPSNIITSSGGIHVEKFYKPNTPLYFAYKYISDTAAVTWLPRKWTVSAFSLKSYFKDTIVTHAANFESGGFHTVTVLNNIYNWTYTNTTLTFNAPAVGALPCEDWAVSRPINTHLYPANRSLTFNDLGTILKNAAIKQSEFKYAFEKPGIYNVVFVATNNNIGKSLSIARTLTITVNP